MATPAQSPRELGTVTRRWTTTDERGTWRHREEVLAIAECPRCGEEVELLAETEEWQETHEGSRVWKHTGYGPAMGQCCGMLIADWWEGTCCYDLERSHGY